MGCRAASGVASAKARCLAKAVSDFHGGGALSTHRACEKKGTGSAAPCVEPRESRQREVPVPIFGSCVSGCDTNPKRQRGPSLALRVGVTAAEICTQKRKSSISSPAHRGGRENVRSAWKVLSLAVGSVTLLAAIPAVAHDLGVIRAELREQTGGNYQLSVTVTSHGPLPEARPILPARCALGESRVTVKRPGVAVLDFTFACSGAPLGSGDFMELPWGREAPW